MPQSTNTNNVYVKDVKLSTAISGHSEKLPGNTSVLGVQKQKWNDLYLYMSVHTGTT
jgi:hypothetical protein